LRFEDLFEELLEEFELELLDELELELLDEFELELPAEAGWVPMADSTARTTASGGELPTDPSVAAAVATRPQAPSPAAYVFQCLGILFRLSIIEPRFQWGLRCALHWSPHTVRRP
jgi:recombinational DNA repair protein (RecF pathway)